MERIIIDENLRGKELYKFLRANKAAIIAQKKSVIKFTEPAFSTPVLVDQKGNEVTKSANGTISEDATILRVKVVMNTSLWVDSDQDLLLRDNATKSIKETKPLIKHLKNHGRTLDDEVADIIDIYYEDVALKKLGYNKSGNGQALVFDSNVKKSYDESTFQKYKNKRINQHSIGLKYVRLELAINDEEDEKEKDFWDKYYSQIINPEAVDEKGYFWVVPEIKLIEGSAVLFGSNMLTPTLEVSEGTGQDDPPPSKSEVFDFAKTLQEIKFFN